MRKAEVFHRTRRVTLSVSVAVAAAVAGCGTLLDAVADPAAPGRVSLQQSTFSLRSLDGIALPATLSATEGGRRIDVVEGSLTFAGLDSAAVSASGQVTVRSVLRIVDTGRPAASDPQEATATFRRTGDTVEVRYADGGTRSYVLEQGGRRLRTIGSSCPPAGPAGCLSILRVYVYERATPPGG